MWIMKKLIYKYLKGNSTEAEEKLIYDWLQENNLNAQIFKEEVSIYMLSNTTNEIVNEQKAFDEFKFTITHRKESNPDKTYPFKKYYKYAAAVVVILCCSVFFNNYWNINTSDLKSVTVKPSVEIDFNNKIVLTLNDGSASVVDKKQEELSYVPTRSEEISVEEQLVYNELTVPRGQVFRLVLSDSTVVWLNADTKIKFPKKFINSLATRTVWLEGEAFFEVAHNKKKPFIVNTNGVDIKVLGTKFNVSSYSNDPTIHTTLVEGSVQVVATNNRANNLYITPNKQVAYEKDKMLLTVKEVNTLDYTSWMQKVIIFNDIPFEEIIPKIERTYNVNIVNMNTLIAKERFTGQFDIENIETVFKALSTSYKFKYTIENDLITIK